MTLTALAREAGLSFGTVRRIDSGKEGASILTALRIAAVLEAEVEDLFGEPPCP